MTEEQVFLAALDLPDQADRTAYLNQACCQNSELRCRVEELLAAHERSGQFLDEPAAEQIAAGLQPSRDQTLAFNADCDDAMADHKKTNPSPRDDASEDLQFLSPSTRPDSLGRLGHYEVLQVLGRGGFGIVFRAFDDILQRVVAVKVMAPQIATLSPARKRFVREAQSSARVRHENVVQVYEVGEQPLPYLTMEFIPGETLQQKLDRSGPLDVSEVLRIGRQVSEGLAAAHACDLIHRDIKPGNILLEGGSHKAKITDFGLARAADDASISQSGIIAGTPMFMAPEQALGHNIDQRADLFSLGSVLYQMASGRPPFRAPSALAVLKRVAEEPPRPIPEIIPETPDWLCGIIAKLHAKNPADRFQSAREVADLLADCEAKLKAKQEVKNVLPAVVKPVPRRSRRIGGKWKWAAAVALVLLLGAGWFGRAAMLYVENSGELEFLPQEGLVSVIVLQNDEGVIDGNKLHAPVTDWLDMTQSHTLKLPPGRYQLNVGAWPAGIHVSQWAVTTSGPFRSHQVTVPVINTSAIVTVERGHRVTLLAVMRDRPRPVPVAKQEPLPPTFKNGIGMEFVIVPKGKSWLGGGKDKLGDTEVEIPADFYLGKYEVTQEEWEKVMGENPSFFSRTGMGKDRMNDIPDADLKRFPVETVTLDQCQIFVEKLNRLEKETGWVYRLPKEAEWEYACRGGPMSDKLDSAFDFYFAKPTNTLLPEQANFNKGLNRSCKVGSYEPNRLGLFDMHGNVLEWCDDTGKAVGSETHRVRRGGGWDHRSGDCLAALHIAIRPSVVSFSLGLRLARVPSGAPSPEVKTPPLAVAPFADADVRRIAALPAAAQVEEVRKELMRRNPEFDGVVEPTFEKDAVIGLKFSTLQVTDISAVRALTRLQTLNVGNWNRGKGVLADLSPLNGMALVNLNCSSTRVSDLSPLKGMKLQRLEAGDIEASDLAPLQGMPLTHLGLHGSLGVTGIEVLEGMPLEYLNLTSLKVADLSVLRGMMSLRWLILARTPVADLAPVKDLKLRELNIQYTKVSDLSALQGMELSKISLTPKNITKGLELIRDMKSLKTIGITATQFWPAAEFWERYDKGEFTK